MSDPLDQPEQEQRELVYPFVICASQGGPYDDEAFVAGFRLGMIDTNLTLANHLNGVEELAFAVATNATKQLELLGMARGFPVVEVEAFEETPEWAQATFRRTEATP